MKPTRTQGQVIKKYLAGRHARRMPPQTSNAISVATNIPKQSTQLALKNMYRRGLIRREGSGGRYLYSHIPSGGKSQWVPSGVRHAIVRFLQNYRRKWVTVGTVRMRVGCSASQASASCSDLWARGLLDLEKRVSRGRKVVFVRATEAIDSVECVGCDGCGGPLGGRAVYCKDCLPVNDPAKPCSLKPGSPEKIKLLTERYASGIPPWVEHLPVESYEVPLGASLL